MNYTLPVELYEIISDVVDAMRETNSINGVETDGVNYRYTASNSLSANDFISITDHTTTYENIKILSADSTGFVIKTEYATALTFKANAPYYMHEKEVKAANILTEKTGKGVNLAWQKYPLIYLVHSYTDKRGDSVLGYTVPFTIHIITDVPKGDLQDYSDDRYEKRFDPILFPLYKSFLEKLALNRWTGVFRPQDIVHDKTDLLEINGNPFPDVMDGITLSFDGLKIKKNKQSCTPITPAQYDLKLSTGTGGTIEPVAGTTTRNVNVIVPINATASAGYKFKWWTINGIKDLASLTYVKMSNNITAIAEFIAQWTLTTSVDGDGTITPASGIYDDGDVVDITVTVNNPATHEIDRVEEDGTPITSPYSVVMNAAKSVIAYIVSLFSYQEVLTVGDVIESDGADGWQFPNASDNDVPLAIKDTMMLTMESSYYFTFVDLAGATIVSNGGTSIPTKISDQRIDFTAGTLWNLVLSNGSALFCNDASGVRIADYLGLHDGTLIGATQSIAWGTFSDAAKPYMLTNGGGQYLDTITAGTSYYDLTGGTGITIPTYGEYLFDINKAADLNISKVSLNSLTTSSGRYTLYLYNDNSIAINDYLITSLFRTAPNYISINTNYRLKITISELGVITAYIKGGSFGSEYVLITPTSGSNPATNTSYSTGKSIVVDNDAGDSIHAISKDGVRYDPMHFVDGTGTTKVRNSIQIGTSGIDADGNAIEFDANVGFWNTGNTLQNKDDATLNAKFDEYAALSVLKYPNKFTFDQLNDLDLTGIPADEFTRTTDGTVITDMKLNP